MDEQIKYMHTLINKFINYDLYEDKFNYTTKFMDDSFKSVERYTRVEKNINKNYKS